MKVTVCFEEVRVIVPCGDGEILVRELIDKAITRYKKATGKSNNHWVSVHNVKAISGGGILDPDDQLNDVVDDREQLIADFEEQGRPGLHHNGGDGASASSTGTASPDIFQTGDLSNAIHRPFPISLQNGKTDVIVTPRDLSLGTSLTVRRGSEPALNLLTDDGPIENGDSNIVPVRGRKESHQESDEPRSESESDDDRVISQPKDPKEKSPLSRFQRDSKRQSLSNNPDMYRWLEAHDNQQDRLKQQPVIVERKGPIGGSGTEADVKLPHKDSDGAIIIVLKNDGGPLGIHVIPDIDDDGKELGLVLQGIEKGGRIERDGRLRVNDRIIEINGKNLEGVTFDDAQKIFREAMRTAEVRLKVVKHRAPPPLPKQPPPLMPKPKGHAPVKPSPLTLPPPKGDNSLPSSPEKTSSPLEVGKPLINNNNVNEKNVNLGIMNNNQGNKMPGSPLPPRDKLPIQPGPPLKVASPTKKTPPAVPQRHPSTTLSTPKEQAINTLTNTRKIGRKIQIQLQKGALGLGFSITSRDNPTGESPIYIKNILVKGAAVQDGRLKPGDRLLEVNGVEMTGKSQSEAVGQLRSIPEGHVCNLVVSRQEVVDELFRMPRELSDEKTPPPVLQPGEASGEEATVTNIKNKEVIKFEIPLNDTGSAGLGVSVKGKTTTTAEGTKDLGIFIKSVMHGGAASKDGRLLVNDQLLEVHGIPLTNMSNVKAMDQLRRAMQVDGPMCGFILLTVARKIGAPSPFQSSENSLDTTDGSQFEVLNHGVTIYGEKNHSRSSSGDNTLFARGENSGQSRGDNSARTRVDASGNGQPNGVNRTKPSNSAVDRLITGDGGNGLRNESYNRATHESFDVTPDSSPAKPSQLGKVAGQMRDDVIIENDMYAIPRKRQPPPRPHSTLGIPHISPAHSRSSSMEDYNDDQHHRQQQHQRGSASDWSSELQDHDELSPTGDFEFQREGFGRQSMSEKRKGHIDPRGSEFYQRVKETRDTKGMTETSDLHEDSPRLKSSGSMESLLSNRTNNNLHEPTHPSQHNRPFPQAQTRQSNLKRSSSFEDLASDNVPQMEVEEIPAWRFARIGRPRACNDSFRAAVDRSYDAPTPDHNVMDTLEEESMESGSLNHTQSNSARSSFSSENTNEDFHSLRKKKHKDKKGGGILKGLIRLSKGRKSNEENVRRSRSAERPSDSDVRARQLEQERLVLAQQEQDRIREFEAKRRQQMEMLEQQKQQQLEQQKQQQLKQQLKQQQLLDQQQKLMHENRPMFYDPLYNQDGFSHPADRGVSRAEQRGGQSRAEKIQQLRVHHQQQHRERHGQYPHEDIEEFYERQIQEEERKRMMERERELAGRLRPPSRTEMERVAHVRMGSHDSTSNFHQYPSVSDTSSYSDQSQHSHFSHNNYPHQRDRPQSRGAGQYPDPTHPDRPSSRGPQQYADEWYQTQPDFTNVNRQTAFTRLNPKNGPNFYGDPARAYRDPKFPAIAGRRPVQTITDPSSAKV